MSKYQPYNSVIGLYRLPIGVGLQLPGESSDGHAEGAVFGELDAGHAHAERDEVALEHPL